MPRPRTPKGLAEQALALVRRGYTQAAAAALAGISLATLERLLAAQRQGLSPDLVDHPLGLNPGEQLTAGRCRSCGAKLAVVPCRACRLRAFMGRVVAGAAAGE